MAKQSPLEGKHEPVAIVGMGCRWAGGVKDSPSLWDLLKNKRDGWREFQEPHFPASTYYHANQDRPGSVRTRGGFLIGDDARLFDHSFFGILAREVETMDPSQRKLLEVVYEAFENAGETWDSISGSRTGVYIGNFALDHLLIQSRDWDYTKPYAATGAETSILANRLSYVFNLHGPSLATNTACSSSMYALHLAVSAIRSGDCDGAIVAAANWISDPSMQIVLDKLGALSPTSRCHTFDVAADGYARGEGFVALYLKKSALAVLEKSPIRAMIRGTAVNANGKTGGITRPSARGQEDAIRKAYENAGDLPFSDTTFFECHGTGTPAGDPLEVAAVGNVFASSRSDAPEDRLLIGSIKPNLGHTEGASALASIMKVVLAIEAGEVPPTFGVENLNPHIDFDGAKVTVVKDAAIPWPKGKLRRASVNSFGFGGANGHCIIDHVNNVLPGYSRPGIIHALNSGLVTTQIPESASTSYIVSNSSNGHSESPSSNDSSNDASSDTSVSTPPLQVRKHSPITDKPQTRISAEAATRQLVLLPFSAHNSTSLQSNVDALSKAIEQHSLADVAYTLGSKRSRMQSRSFRIVNKDNLLEELASEGRVFTSPIQTSNVAFVFTGQGAQWHGMGSQLFEYAVFRDTISYLDYVLEQLPVPPSWTVSASLLGKYEQDHIQSPKVSQVVCTAIQIAIVDLLASWSVRPVAVVGHSSGEMAASYASGHFTAAEAIAAAYFRGQSVIKNKANGAMLAVGLGEEEVAAYLDGREQQVRIAAMNSPGSVTLSGDADVVDQIANALNQDRVFNRILRTSGSAYHSHHMVAVGGEYVTQLQEGVKHLQKHGLIDQTERYPTVPWVSSVHPEEAVVDSELTARYWRENLESPVRFTQAVSKMMTLDTDTPVNVLIEIGPHAALKGPLEQTIKAVGKSAQYVPTLRRNEDSRDSLLQLAGTLFAVNAQVDLAVVNSVDNDLDHEQHTVEHGCLAIDLPTYQYTYGPMSYYESRASKEYRIRKFPRHDLLGSELPGASKLQPQWRNMLRIKDVPWLSDHRLLPDAVFPAAGYVALGIEAATRVYSALPEALNITGYSLQNVDISTSLAIPEDDYGVEVITSLESLNEPTARSPSWAKFSVVSVARESGEWTHHCTGKVKVDISSGTRKNLLSKPTDPRFPSVPAWYEKFKELGLGYGSTFQPLSNLTVDPDRDIATANISLKTTAGNIQGGESYYPLHPAALDAVFQLAIITFYGGQLEKANAAFVPIHIGSMLLDIEGMAANDIAKAVTRGSTRGQRDAYADLQMADTNGSLFLDVKDMQFTNFRELKLTNGPHHKQPFSSPFARLVWKPDIRTVNAKQARELFPPPAENAEGAAALEVVDLICCLVVFDIYDRFVGVENEPKPKGDIRHWLAWIKRIAEGDQRPNMITARNLTPDQRRARLQELHEEAGHKPEARAAKLLQEHAAEILAETRTGIDILISNKLLTALYEVGHAIAGSHPQVFNIMDALGHANPNMRILEIGAGTGAATRAAMKALVGPNGIKRYADYTFTDISAGFLTSAKEMLSEHRDVHYSVLDVEQDPMKHGYEPVYDVVLACEAIHATESMDRTLAHCRSLLKPGGKLVLVETTRMRVLLGLLYGTLTGYWQSDGRTEGPFMNLETWQRRLTETGFSGVDLHVDDYDSPHNTTSVLITTRVESQEISQVHSTANDGGSIYLLHDGNAEIPLLQQVAAEAQRRGLRWEAISLKEASVNVPADSRVLLFLSPRNDLFDADENLLKSFQHLARSAASMVWLSSSNIVDGTNPRGAFMAGLLRVIATENPSGRYMSINVDGEGTGDESEGLVSSILDKEAALQIGELSDISVDSEFVWQHGCMHVSRVVPDVGLGVYSEAIQTPARLGSQMLPIGEQAAVRAAFETPGILSSLYFRPYTELLSPIPDDQVEVKVAAMGLNSQDVLSATGRRSSSSSTLSSEFSGVVTQVGAKVSSLSIGDRVYGIGKGNFGNYERIPAAFARILQPADDLVEVATMPIAYVSAIYAFEHVTVLRPGDNVLIQAAAGDVGLAAIRFAQIRGANVFATTSNSEQAAFLTDDTGIARDRIFDTRDIEAVIQAARSTDKGGFDIVLSTNIDDELESRWSEVVAPLGHLINVGIVDGREYQTATLELLKRGTRLSSIDLSSLFDHDPRLGGDLLTRMHELYSRGQIGPVRPFEVSDVADLDQALSKFSTEVQIGKRVISLQEPNSKVKLLQQPQAARFDPNARYIITGGFGGLGRSIIRWMVSRGARDFIVLSRRGASTPLAKLLCEDMEARGLHLEAIAVDVSKREEVTDVIGRISSANRPIKGVVNAVLSLSDLSFDKLTIEKWRSGTEAKTHGSINLHEATVNLPLDFFVMLTSTETVWAPATQAAYIAADNFAAYFARYRRKLGLPASTVSYGFVSDLGSDYREVSSGTEDMYARNMASTMTEVQALAALEPAFLRSQDAPQWNGSEQDTLSAATFFTCLNPVDLAGLTSVHTPRWHRDGRVALLMRAMQDAKRHTLSNSLGDNEGGKDSSASATTKLRLAFDEAIKAGPDGRAAAVELVVGGISNAIAEMLFMDIASVNSAKSVADHGVDSLIAAELRNWFHQALHTNVQNILDADTSIQVMAGQIVDKALGSS